MAEKGDGSIVLSVNIDGSEVSSGMQKIVSDINKAVQAEAKNLKAVESVNQAKEKTAQAQQKTEQEVYKTLQAESQALTAEQNLITAKERAAAASAKTQVAEQQVQRAVNATAVSEEQVAQAKEKTAQATTQSAINQQKLAQEIEKRYQAEEKTAQAELKTQQEQQKVLLNEEKIKQEKEKTAQAEEKTRQAILKTEKAQKSLKSATNSVTTAIKNMAARLGIYLSLRQLITFGKEASELATQTESNLARLSILYGSSAQDVYDWANANAAALGMSKSAAYEAAADFGNLLTTSVSAAESASLSVELMQATAVMASQTGRTYEETLEKVRSGIYGNTRAIDDLGVSVRQQSLMQTQAWQTISKNGTKSWNDLTDAELQHLRVLAIIEQSTGHYGDTVLQTSSLVKAQFNAAWDDFKATFGQVINLVLVPVLKVLTKIINAVTTVLNGVLSLFGQQAKLSSNTNNNISEWSNGINEATEAQEDYNAELQKSLAGFDTLNILADNTADNTEESDSSAVTTQSSAGQGAAFEGVSDEAKLQTLQTISDILAIAGKALFVIGLLVLCSGNIVLGIGLIAAGLEAGEISEYAAPQEGDDPEEKTQQLLGKIKDEIPKILFGIGAVLLLLGHIPFGIGVMIAGAAMYNIQNTESEEELDFETKLGIIEEAVGAALFVIGVILLLLGHIPFGLGAMLIGAKLYGIGEEKINEKGVQSAIEKFFSDNKEAIIGVAVCLLILGIILLMSGVAFGLGLGLLVGGVIVLAKEEQTNPGSVQETIDKFFKENKEFVAGLGSAMLILGIILMFSGVAFLLGLALLVAGVTVLVKAEEENKGYISKKIDEFIDKHGTFAGTALILLGLILLISGVGIPLGIALIAAGGVVLAKKATMCADSFGKWLKKILNGGIDVINDFLDFVLGGFTDLVNAIIGVGDAILSFVGIDVELPKLSVPHIPHLAKGAVIPANREFLAVLGDQNHGTNVEAPAELIKQMAMEAIAESNMIGTKEVLELLQQGFTSVCEINAQTANAIILTNSNVANLGDKILGKISETNEQNAIFQDNAIANMKQDIWQDTQRTQQTANVISNAAVALANVIQAGNEKMQAQLSALRNQSAESVKTNAMTQTELARLIYDLTRQGQRLAGTSLVK